MFNRYLYWSEARAGIKRKLINMSSAEADVIANSCCAANLAVDILTNKIYWLELNMDTFNLNELSLQTNNSEIVSSFSDDLVPFRMTVLQNYIIVTFDNISKIAVISRKTFIVTLKTVIKPYFAVRVADTFRQPSESKCIEEHLLPFIFSIMGGLSLGAKIFDYDLFYLF